MAIEPRESKFSAIWVETIETIAGTMTTVAGRELNAEVKQVYWEGLDLFCRELAQKRKGKENVNS